MNRFLASHVLAPFACLALSNVQAAAFSFSLDPPEGQAGLASAETPQSPHSDTSTFGGDLAGQLQAVAVPSPGTTTQFTIGAGNLFALDNDLLLLRSGSVNTGIGILDYDILTTLSGFSFELAGGVAVEGYTAWQTAPTITPTGGALTSVMSGTFTPLLGTASNWSGSASASVAHTPVGSDPSGAATLLFESTANPPGADLQTWTVDATLAAAFGYTAFQIDTPTIAGLDLAGYISPIVAAHYDAALTMNGEIQSTAPAPVPLPAAAWLLISGLGCLAVRRSELRH